MIDRKETYLKYFESLENSLNGESKSDLHKLRKEAIAKFTELGFPTTKNEEWKYTNVNALQNYTFKPSDSAKLSTKDIEKFFIKGENASIVVFINGNYSAEHTKLIDIAEGV